MKPLKRLLCSIIIPILLLGSFSITARADISAANLSIFKELAGDSKSKRAPGYKSLKSISTSDKNMGNDIAEGLKSNDPIIVRGALRAFESLSNRKKNSYSTNYKNIRKALGKVAFYHSDLYLKIRALGAAVRWKKISSKSKAKAFAAIEKIVTDSKTSSDNKIQAIYQMENIRSNRHLKQIDAKIGITLLDVIEKSHDDKLTQYALTKLTSIKKGQFYMVKDQIDPKGLRKLISSPDNKTRFMAIENLLKFDPPQDIAEQILKEMNDNIDNKDKVRNYLHGLTVLRAALKIRDEEIKKIAEKYPALKEYIETAITSVSVGKASSRYFQTSKLSSKISNVNDLMIPIKINLAKNETKILENIKIAAENEKAKKIKEVKIKKEKEKKLAAEKLKNETSKQKRERLQKEEIKKKQIAAAKAEKERIKKEEEEKQKIVAAQKEREEKARIKKEQEIKRKALFAKQKEDRLRLKEEKKQNEKERLVKLSHIIQKISPKTPEEMEQFTKDLNDLYGQKLITSSQKKKLFYSKIYPKLSSNKPEIIATSQKLINNKIYWLSSDQKSDYIKRSEKLKKSHHSLVRIRARKQLGANSKEYKNDQKKWIALITAGLSSKESEGVIDAVALISNGSYNKINRDDHNYYKSTTQLMLKHIDFANHDVAKRMISILGSKKYSTHFKKDSNEYIALQQKLLAHVEEGLKSKDSKKQIEALQLIDNYNYRPINIDNPEYHKAAIQLMLKYSDFNNPKLMGLIMMKLKYKQYTPYFNKQSKEFKMLQDKLLAKLEKGLKSKESEKRIKAIDLISSSNFKLINDYKKQPEFYNRATQIILNHSDFNDSKLTGRILYIFGKNYRYTPHFKKHGKEYKKLQNGFLKHIEKELKSNDSQRRIKAIKLITRVDNGYDLTKTDDPEYYKTAAKLLLKNSDFNDLRFTEQMLVELTKNKELLVNFKKIPYEQKLKIAKLLKSKDKKLKWAADDAVDELFNENDIKRMILNGSTEEQQIALLILQNNNFNPEVDHWFKKTPKEDQFKMALKLMDIAGSVENIDIMYIENVLENFSPSQLSDIMKRVGEAKTSQTFNKYLSLITTSNLSAFNKLPENDRHQFIKSILKLHDFPGSTQEIKKIAAKNLHAFFEDHKNISLNNRKIYSSLNRTLLPEKYTKKGCGDGKEIRLDKKGSMSKVPVRQQKMGICFSHAAVQLLDAYRFAYSPPKGDKGTKKEKIQSSALSAAVSQRQDKFHFTKDTSKIQISKDNEFDGGSECDVINHLIKNGGCDRDKVLTHFMKSKYRYSFLDHSKEIFERLKSAKNLSKGFEHLAQNDQQALIDFCRLLISKYKIHEKLLPSIKVVMNALQGKHYGAFVKEILNDRCKDNKINYDKNIECKQTWTKSLSKSDILNNEYRGVHSLKLLHDQFDGEKPLLPLSIGYCANVLSKSDAGKNYRYSGNIFTECGAHASAVIGRRWKKDKNGKGGSCQFLIRNSWGTDCYRYNDDWDCDKGNIWVDQDTINEAIFTISKIQAKGQK